MGDKEQQQQPEPQTEPVQNEHPSQNAPTHPDHFTEGVEPGDLQKDS